MKKRIRLLLVASVLVNIAANAAFAAEPLTKTQEQARIRVHAALRSEVAGDNQNRQVQLNEALAIDPEWPEAHWQLGRIRDGDRWVSIHELQDQNASNPHVAKFREMRDRLAGNPQGELQLARWCRLRRPDVSKYYYGRLLATGNLSGRLRQEAIEQLNLVKLGGRLVRRDRWKEARQAERLYEKAIQRWQPKLVQWQHTAATRGPKSQQIVADQIKEIDDPFFVIAAARFASSKNRVFAGEVIDKLGAFPEYESTQALAAYAIYSPMSSRAARKLVERPKHDFVPVLLGHLRSPIDADWEITTLPGGSMVYSHSLYQAGPMENQHFVGKRSFEFPLPFFEPPQDDSGTWTLDSDSQEIQREAKEQLEEEAEFNQKRVEEYNKRVEARNKAALDALEIVSGQNFDEPSLWWDWWTNFNEIDFERQTRSLTYVDRNFASRRPFYRSRSCFPKGTMVATESGPMAIETIGSGDRVLTQDIESGELSMEVVVAATTRAPSPLLRLTANGKTIDTTFGHPFWVNGSGWKMAKFLEVGDLVHSVSGATQIENIERLPRAQPAFNLIVQNNGNYFVGEGMILVHDNTYRSPTSSVLPGLSAIAFEATR